MRKFIRLGTALCALLIACSTLLTSCDDLEGILNDAIGSALQEESKTPEGAEETKKNNNNKDKDKDKNNKKETEAVHEHDFSNGWSYNKQNHWLECADKTCNKKYEKDDHQWVANGYITKPTPSADGILENICAVCGATTTESVEFNGLSKEEWSDIIAESTFDNYTLLMEGSMTVRTNGITLATSNVKEEMKIADNKMLVTMFATDGNSSDDSSTLFEGNIADTQIAQTSEMFVKVLNKFESFVYHKNTNTYTIDETISYDTVLQSVINSSDGSFTTQELPTTITVSGIEISLSDDGQLLKLVCDYTQSMDMGLGIKTSTSGATTWTFSNYGTTVID